MRVALVVVVVVLVGAVGAGVGYGVGASAGGATGGTADDHADLACQGAEGLPEEFGSGEGQPSDVDLAQASAISGVAGFAEAAAEGDDAYEAMAEPAERLRFVVAAFAFEEYADAVSDLRAACDDR